MLYLEFQVREYFKIVLTSSISLYDTAFAAAILANVVALGWPVLAIGLPVDRPETPETPVSSRSGRSPAPALGLVVSSIGVAPGSPVQAGVMPVKAGVMNAGLLPVRAWWRCTFFAMTKACTYYETE